MRVKLASIQSKLGRLDRMRKLEQPESEINDIYNEGRALIGKELLGRIEELSITEDDISMITEDVFGDLTCLHKANGKITRADIEGTIQDYCRYLATDPEDIATESPPKPEEPKQYSLTLN